MAAPACLQPLPLQTLQADKVPSGRGFSLHDGPEGQPGASAAWQVELASQDDLLLPVTWVPAAPAQESQLLCFKLDGRHRVQVCSSSACCLRVTALASAGTPCPLGRLLSHPAMSYLMPGRSS